jgi:hypothetical protein
MGTMEIMGVMGMEKVMEEIQACFEHSCLLIQNNITKIL